jgi:hypothetical protein
MIRNLARCTLAVLVLSMPALAKGTPPTHQCMKDGAVVQKTKKECAKDGGKWEPIAAAKPADDTKAADKPADTKK